MKFKKVLRELINLGYIGPAGKSPEKYYIIDKPNVFATLSENGYEVTTGRSK